MNQFEDKNYKFDRTVRTGNDFGLPIRKTVRFGPETKSKIIRRVLFGLIIAVGMYYYVSWVIDTREQIHKIRLETLRIRT